MIFRKIEKSDFNEWLKFFADPTTSIHWTEEKQSPQDACNGWYQKQFWRHENDMGGMNALIEKSSGKLIGHCGLLVQTVDETTELEIGYSLLPEFWGKGYASEAATKCKDFAFKNNLAKSLISIISLTNIPSQNVALKNGMIIEKETAYKGNSIRVFRIAKIIGW
ncbi:MAG: GNAT family N-acetyltransferase [Flammeovirgaceae bacterium]|nr:GNAT family N-acetyltransferase [Flammeovirgaceae bacterium]